MELLKDRNEVEVGNRKMELERQFIELNKRRGMEIEENYGINESSKQRFNMER